MTFSIEDQKARLAQGLGAGMVPLSAFEQQDSERHTRQMILDPRDGKLWDNPDDYAKEMTAFFANQSRQIRSSHKYVISEDEHEVRNVERLNYSDAVNLLRSCETEIENAYNGSAIFCVEDEGLFVAREQSIPYYFRDMIGWHAPPSTDSDVEDDGGMLRVCGSASLAVDPLEEDQGATKFDISTDALMALDPSDRAIISDMVATVTMAQQRRVALERNRLRLHVLVEDGIRGIELHTGYINAINIYDHMMRLQHRCADKSDQNLLAAIENYRELILKPCLNNLKCRRSAICNITRILNQCRIWIEDLLERAVATERQVSQTIDELLKEPAPLLNVSPPNISEWMLEAEQVAHTCANLSYMITTKLELNPKKLDESRGRYEKTWLLGIPRFEAFVYDSDSDFDSVKDSGDL